MAAHCRSVSDEEKTMIRAIMNGCHGVMGHVITDIISKDDAIEIVAGVDMNTETYAGYPVFKSLAECPEADVIIDFSTAKAVPALLAFSKAKKIPVVLCTKVPVVLCTTGLSEDQLNHVKEASKVDAVLRSANMSIGINLLMKTLKEVAPVLAAAGFDIEILEKHHNRKIDAPSGTAIALADAINESLDNTYHYKYDRSSERVARDPKEIGIQAMRGGTIVGGIVDLVIGLLGLRGAKNPRKVGPFFVLCIIGLVLGLVGLGMSLAQGTFDLWSLVSVVIVAVCLYLSAQVKKQA